MTSRKKKIIIVSIVSLVLSGCLVLAACKSKKKESAEEIDNTNYISAPQTAILKTPATSPSFSNTPTFTVQGVEEGDTVYLYKNSRCTEQALLGNGVVPAEQTEVDITINALSVAGRYGIYAKRVNAQGDPSRCSAKLAAYHYIACPDASYVPVEGNAELGTTPFCVMRTEAKLGANTTPVSQNNDVPWENLTAFAAKQACKHLKVPYGSCDLLSNRQWMTMALDIESTAANWSEGVVGSGMLNRGHSDYSADHLSISDETDPWDQTGQDSSTWHQKRTHILSNGEVIWDLAGNVQEWVDWDLSDSRFTLGPKTCDAEYKSPLSFTCEGLDHKDYFPANPAGKTELQYYASVVGVGKITGTSAEQIAVGGGGATTRGGNFKQHDKAGIFAMSFELDPEARSTSIGFRCGCLVEGENFDETFLAPPHAISLKSPHASPSFSNTPIFTVHGGEAGDTIRLYSDSTCSEPSSLGSGVVAAGADAVDIATTLPGVGDYYLYATRTNPAGQTSACSRQLSSYQMITCPGEFYMPVQGNPLLGTGDFCVMRVEARQMPGEIPFVDYETAPWQCTWGSGNRKSCRKVPLVHGVCDLMSNRQWMTIARDIEATDANWSGGVVGSGKINQGHSDASPDRPLSIQDPNDPWDQTDPEGFTTPWSQKRTHILSSGEVIWDFAGGVSETVLWEGGTYEYSLGPNTCESGWKDLFSMDCPDLNPLDYLPANPANIPIAEYTGINYGIGKIYGTTEEKRAAGSGGSAIRGGDYHGNLNGLQASGIYNLDFHLGPGDINYYVGFRCVCNTTDPEEEL